MNEDAMRRIFEEEGITTVITCPQAFEIAERHGVLKLEIAEYCNKVGIKIRGCQLGCFK